MCPQKSLFLRMSQITLLPNLIMLADDDADDRLLFEEALKEIDRQTEITTATDGEELMNLLSQELQKNLSVIFLDLNMPKKNGFECLQEIRQKDKLKHIPVVVYSTSCQGESIDKMYEFGASYYICKPNNFNKLKNSIEHIFSIGLHKLFPQPSKEDFVIAY